MEDLEPNFFLELLHFSLSLLMPVLALPQVGSPEEGIELELEVWDKDTLSSDDFIGKVGKNQAIHFDRKKLIHMF